MAKVELLAPSGNFECVKAAVANGADAVYLGGQQFSARAYANNFSNEELEKVCDYCHSYGVKVYVTVNTLYKDNEFEQMLSFVGELYAMGVDGLIMQDLGAISAVRQCYPDMPVHASTQLTANSMDEVRAFEKMGLTTVVLSRELSVEEIRNICSQAKVRIEVFIHGALCVSYSGQCYISSVLGNRSGNRGRCAQNCRMEYDLLEENRKVASGHLLSTKDICTIDNLGELLDAGVASLKIEGRMKAPEYVRTVTGTYRKYIDEYYKGNRMKLKNEDLLALQYSFNRGGFSAGYLKMRSGPDMMCPIHPRNWGVFAGRVVSYDANREQVTIRFNKDMNNGDGVEIWSDDANGAGFYINKPVKAEQTAVFKVKGNIRKNQRVYQTFNKELNDAVNRDYQNNRRKLNVSGKVIIKDGTESSLILNYGNIAIAVKGDVPQPSLNQPLTRDTVIAQLSRTGNTNVRFERIETILDDGLFMNRSQLNALRNQAIDKLNEEILDGSKRFSTRPVLPQLKEEKNKEEYRLSVLVETMDQLEAVLTEEKVETIYLPVTGNLDLQEAVNRVHQSGRKRVIKVPRLWRQHTQKTYEEVLNSVRELDIDGYLIHNIGQYEHFSRFDKPLYLDYTGNIINSYSRKFWDKLARKGLSIEASLQEINGLRDDTDTEVLVYGKLPLMITEQCPVGNFVGNKKKLFCRKKNSGTDYYLERGNDRFYLSRDCQDCVCSIMTSAPLKRFSLLRETSVPFYRLDFSSESPSEIRNLLKELKKAVTDGTYEDSKLAGIYYRSIA